MSVMKFIKILSLLIFTVSLEFFYPFGESFCLRIPVGSGSERIQNTVKKNSINIDYFYHRAGLAAGQTYELAHSMKQKRNIQRILSIPHIQSKLRNSFELFNLGCGTNPLPSLDGVNCRVTNFDPEFMSDSDLVEDALRAGANFEHKEITQVKRNCFVAVWYDLPYFIRNYAGRTVIWNKVKGSTAEEKSEEVLRESFRHTWSIIEPGGYFIIAGDAAPKEIRGVSPGYMYDLALQLGLDVSEVHVIGSNINDAKAVILKKSTVIPERPIMAKILSEKFPDSEKISFADLDTGTGEFVTDFTVFLKKHFKDTEGVGVEMFEKFVDKARENGHNVVHGTPDVKGDYEKAGLADNSKDVVTVNNIESREWALIEQADRMLKENGLILITFEYWDINQEGVRPSTEERKIIKYVEDYGYTTQVVDFPEDYPRSESYVDQSDAMLIAWKGDFHPASEKESGKNPQSVNIPRVTVRTTLGKKAGYDEGTHVHPIKSIVNAVSKFKSVIQNKSKYRFDVDVYARKIEGNGHAGEWLRLDAVLIALQLQALKGDQIEIMVEKKGILTVDVMQFIILNIKEAFENENYTIKNLSEDADLLETLYPEIPRNIMSQKRQLMSGS